jgi:hypothetical protein
MLFCKMMYSSDKIYLKNKTTVIEYLRDIARAKSKEAHTTRMREDMSYRIMHKTKCFFGYESIKTIGLTDTSIDFLLATSCAWHEIEEKEKYIIEVINRSGRNKNVLNECEQYFQGKIKVHSARMPSIISNLSIVTAYYIFIIALFFGGGIFPSLKSASTPIYIIGLSVALIPLINIFISVIRPIVESNHLTSTFLYEECIQLLKCAQIRLG